MAATPQDLDLTQFGGNNNLDLSQFQPQEPQARNPLTEVGTGLARGALADLPTMAGQALQFAGANNVGSTVRNFGQGMAAQPWLTMQPESHSGVTNFLAQGAEQVGAIAPAVAAGAGAAVLGAPALLATGVGAATGGALMAGQAGQTTLEAAQAKGLSPEAAQSASRLNAASTFATQVGLGMVGGKVLGVAGNALGKAVGSEAAPLADQVLNQLTGANGWLGQGLKQGAIGAAEATGIGAVQAGTSAAINNAYGIDDKSPLAAAAEAIPQMLSLSAVLTPLGLASRALQVRAAAAKTATLASETTDPALRQKYADEYTNALPSAEGSAFAENAKTAIDNKLPLKVDTGLFQNGAVTAPVPETPAVPGNALAPENAPPALTNNPSPNIVFPDGTVARNQQEVDDYIGGLPEHEQAAARAKLLGFGAQPADAAPEAAPLALTNNPSPVVMGQGGDSARTYTFPDGSSTNDINTVQEHLDSLPAGQRAAARAKIFGFEPQATSYEGAEAPREAAVDIAKNLVPDAGISAMDAINSITGVDREGLNKQELAKRKADAVAAFKAPSGVRVSGADGVERELSSGELYDMRNAVNQAEQPQDGKPALLPPPTPRIGQPGQTTWDLPDGSSTNDFNVVQAHLDSLPAGQRPAARAHIFGFEPQANTYEAASDPRTAAVDTMRDAVANPTPGLSAKDMINSVTGADRGGLSKAERTQREADAKAALTEPSGIRVSDSQTGIERELTMGEVYDLRNQPVKGPAPEPVPGSAKAPDAITADITAANKEATGSDTITQQALRPMQKQLDALGIDKMTTHQEQIDALDAHLNNDDTKIGPATRERLGTLLAKWKAENPQAEKPIVASPAEPSGNATIPAEAAPALTVPPAQADALPENIPASVETQAPTATNAALPNTLTEGLPTRTELPEHLEMPVSPSTLAHASETADMVDATLADMNARIRKGETLPALEQRRQATLQTQRDTLAKIASGEITDDMQAQGISDAARKAATTPYTAGYRKNSDPTSRINPGVLDAIGGTRKLGALNDVLDHIAQNGATDEARGYAKFLRGLNLDTKIMGSGLDHPDTEGMYYPKGSEYGDQILLHNSGLSEQTILHEATHAAQQSLVSQAQEIVTPKTQREAELKRALTTIESIRQKAIERAGADAHYGLTDAHEFLAELNTNPEFQHFLKSELVNGKQSLWQRAVGAVKSLLGLKTGDMLSRAMEANESFFQKPNEAGFPLRQGSEPAALFRKSPTDATKVADDQLSKIAGLADKLTDKIDVTNLNQKAYRALAAWKTVEFLADRVRALPEMVQSGFSRGVDAFVHANMVKEVIHRSVAAPMNAYAERLTKARESYGDNARDVEGKMGTIGPEASRGGFDYRMNYADNVKAGRTLSLADKSHVDDIHRQFTQLQRTNPEAAKLLVEGQLLNQKGLVNLTSVVARNLMAVASGSHSRYADDLAKLAPTDPAHAAALARVQASQAGHDMASLHGDKLNIMDEALASARNTKPDTFFDGASQALDARLNAAFADARKLPQGSALRGHLSELEQMYRAQSQNPYFALGRDGEYFVKASLKGVDEATQQKIQDALKGSNKVAANLVGHDGDIFFRTDTMDQASGLHEKLKEAAGLKMVPNSNAYGKLAMSDPQFVRGTSQALRMMLDDLHSTVENSGLSGAAADAMRETLTRSVLSLLPETSSRSAKMNRQGIPGYDADFSGNYARRAMGMAQDTANLYSQHAFDNAFSQMKAGNQQLNRTGSEMAKERSTDTMNEITKRYANMHSVVDNKVINTINSLGHAFYLAMSPAYLIRTTAQLFHRGLPYLGSKYGMVNSAKEIGAATKDALLITGSSLKKGWQAEGIRGTLNAKLDFQNSNLSESEKAFMQEAHDRGYLDLGQTRQLQNMALGGTQRQQDLQRFASITAQAAETTNRLATGLAAFRLAEKGTKNVTQAGREANIEYGIKAINNVMDNFDPTNTARAIGKHGFAGRATPLMTAFMNYNLQTMQQIARTVHDGMFNQDKSAEGLQRASEARKEFSGLMATTMMISGAMGLPFANVFAGLYNTYKDVTDPNNPGDIRDDAQNFLANTFGKTAGGVLAHGLPHAANFDSSTFGLENLLPGSEFLSSRQLLKDRLSDQAASLMGPALNGGIGILQAMDKMKDGYWAKGIEAALPSGLKPYFKAYELSQKGYTDGKDNPLPMDKPTGWDIGLQAAGFRTADKATQSDVAAYAGMRRDRLGYQKGLIDDQFNKARISGDPAVLQDATDSLQKYNAANPTQAIRNEASSVRMRAMQYMLGMNSGLGVGVSRHELPTLSANLAFARSPNAAMPGE